MNWLENMKIPQGSLEVLVKNHYTGELIKRDHGQNQIQDWARHSLAYLSSGRLFCTWGNHGEEISDIGSPHTIPHIADGTLNTAVTESPWKYSDVMSGLIQVRTYTTGDSNDGTTTTNAPLYPFFPTKMRFGIGGLDIDQNPKTDISTSSTSLISVQSTFPYVLIERSRSASGHIALSSSTAIEANHQVTYSVTLPGGGGGPYDGYVLSEAGLFCDAGLLIPPGDTNMRSGILMAYRTFYGITKNESIDITFNWTFRF